MAASPAAYRHYGCRITDDLIYKGHRTLLLENDLLRIGILLDKGADLFSFLHKPTDTDFLWRSPLGLRDPRRATPTNALASGAFLDTYHGGWQECLPGGGPFAWHGAEIGLHGEVTHLGWDVRILTDTPDCVQVECSVDCMRFPLRLVRRMRLERGNPSLFFDEELTNLSPEPIEFMWGHHPALGAPFLSPAVRLVVPAARGTIHTPQFAASGIFEPGAAFAWPHALRADGSATVDLSRVQPPDAGFADLIYLDELAGGWCALLDSERQLGFGMAWDVDVMPCVWFWLVYGRAPGYPWWDRTYCVALEPWSGFPNSFAQAQAQGRASHIQGNGRLCFALTATAITGAAHISAISRDGTVS